eukprot:s465_g22.t1
MSCRFLAQDRLSGSTCITPYGRLAPSSRPWFGGSFAKWFGGSFGKAVAGTRETRQSGTRPDLVAMAVSMGEAAKEVIFERFRGVATSFRVAGVALRDIPTCFKTCRKSFCVAGAILLRRFQKLTYVFRGRRNTLEVSIVIFRGRRSTLDVSFCLFLRIALSGLHQGVKTCKSCGRRGTFSHALAKRCCLWGKLQK